MTLLFIFKQVKEINGQYDQNTGNYGDDNISSKKINVASVMDTSTKTMQLIYGTIKREFNYSYSKSLE